MIQSFMDGHKIPEKTDVSTSKAKLWSPETSYAKSEGITNNKKLFPNMRVFLKLNTTRMLKTVRINTLEIHYMLQIKHLIVCHMYF